MVTKRESELLELIASSLHAKGVAPSYRELLKLLGLSSPGTIYKQIQKLKAKGLIMSDESGKVIHAERRKEHESKNTLIKIPVIGSIAKGEKLELFATMRFCELPDEIVGKDKNCYGFTVRDHSFERELLRQGDLLIVEIEAEPQVGQLLLVITKEGLDIMRFEELDEEGDFQIHGILLATLRSYSS